MSHDCDYFGHRYEPGGDYCSACGRSVAEIKAEFMNLRLDQLEDEIKMIKRKIRAHHWYEATKRNE